MNSDRDLRVPLRSPPSFIQADDVAASITSDRTRYAKRFSLDVAEEALKKMGPYVVEHVAQQLGESVVRRYQPAIESAVFAYLTDRTWAEPIIRKAIEDSTRRFIFDMLTDMLTDPPSPSGDNQT